MTRDARFSIASFDLRMLDEQPVLAEHGCPETSPRRHRSSVMGHRAFMMALALTYLLLACGCDRPLYEATPTGTELTAWEPTVPVTDLGEPVIQELKSPSGVGYRVEARTGTHEAKRLPAHIKVQLTANPVGAEVQVQCTQTTHYAGDAPGVLTTACEVKEHTGTKGLRGEEKNLRFAYLFVKGDGAVSLQEPKP